MKYTKHRTVIAMLTLLLFSSGSATFAAQTQEFEVPLTDPGRPLNLQASLLYGSITIEGHDGRNVMIQVVSEETSGGDERARGMRVIPNTSLGLVVEEENNVLEVQGNWASKIEMLRIKVPRRTSAQLQCTNECDILVQGVEGAFELRNVNGEIHALDVSGSVVANTTNGDVKVVFLRATADTPMSFVTLNGDVDVTFPGKLDADLRIEAGQGEVFTDFDFKVQPQKPVASSGRDGGRYRLELNQAVHARIGNGGPEMRFKTWNGDIFVRKSGR